MKHPRACILPPDLVLRVAREATPERRLALLETMSLDHSFRQNRAEVAALRPVHLLAVAARGLGGAPRRMIYDQRNSTSRQPGTLARTEGQPAVSDASVNQAYDGFGYTYDLYWKVFNRDSIDGQGMTINGLVHFGDHYDNAYWDGAGHMFFGDGDGQLLTDTTKGIDVIGHELTHGVTQNEANLTYQDQSGALNESISDVFGSLVKQHNQGQTAAQADWLIGADIVGPELSPALRSMKDPGKANPHDNQPADMDHYVQTTDDSGGVHANSGIPNRAFYVVATTIGGQAWLAPGLIWYGALCSPALTPDATFAQFAGVTLAQASAHFGATSKEVDAVKAGWDAVKVPLP